MKIIMNFKKGIYPVEIIHNDVIILDKVHFTLVLPDELLEFPLEDLISVKIMEDED